ncbi:MAG: CpaD family pilus assembly protein [Xanthobacteraceae bacterium]
MADLVSITPQGGRVIGLTRILVLALAAMALSGCYTTREVADNVPNDYRLRHPITIQEGEKRTAIFIGNQRGSLTATQRIETVAIASAWKKEATGGIVIDVPTGTPNERSAAEAAREVRSLLVAAEVPAQVIAVRGYRPVSPEKFAPINVKYSRVTADAGPCGLWPKDLGPDADPIWRENRPYWNLGCSHQHNLAVMVDNPEDLVQPRGETPIPTARRAQALDEYRLGQSPATVYPDANQGKISDVGK